MHAWSRETKGRLLQAQARLLETQARLRQTQARHPRKLMTRKVRGVPARGGEDGRLHRRRLRDIDLDVLGTRIGVILLVLLECALGGLADLCDVLSECHSSMRLR